MLVFECFSASACLRCYVSKGENEQGALAQGAQQRQRQRRRGLGRGAEESERTLVCK